MEIKASSNAYPAKDVATGTVYYGGQLYRVVENNGTTMTLFMDGSLGNMAYDSSAHENWSGSDICLYLNNATNGFLSTLSAAEQAAIPAYGGTTVVDTANNVTIDESQKIVLPSYEEVRDGGTWGMTDASRSYSDYWWLRSPGSFPNYAAVVNPGGSIVADGGLVDNTIAVRPAFKLNLSSVLFTSAASEASGKNSVTAGSGSLAAAESPTGAIKLTVSDDTNLSLSTTTTALSAQSGSTVSIPYTDAQTGTNRSVSVVISDTTSGEVLFYGRPVDCSSGNDDGTASFTLPAAINLPAGTYTLRIFNEEVNGENFTDYASTPIDISLTVDNTKPTVASTSPANAATDVSLSTNTLSVTFDEAMDTATAGTVSLTASVGSAPVVSGTPLWSNSNKTVTYTLSGLVYSTTYTYNISGFRDVAGNQMDEVTSGISFGTVKDPSDFDCWFEGASTFTKGTNTTITFVANKDFALHSHTTVDDTTLNASQVSVISGSTKATLQASCLETLSVGTHRIKLHFTDGTFGYGTFEVKDAATPAPTPDPTDGGKLAKTGDATSLALPITLGLLALTALTAGAVLRTKRRYCADGRQ